MEPCCNEKMNNERLLPEFPLPCSAQIGYTPCVSLFSFLSDRPRPTLEELEREREHRSDGIRGVLGVTTIILLVLVAFLVSTLVLPPLLELHTLNRQLETAQRQLEHARAEEEEAQKRFFWMQDPEYFEQIARERADQAKPGETIIRFAPAEPAKSPAEGDKAEAGKKGR